MNNIKLLLILSILSVSCPNCFGQIDVMSFNIRYDNPNDGENWWEHRKNEVIALLKYYQPDFIGLQEAMPNQNAFIDKHLESYNYIGQERDGLNTNSEAAPIYYNKEKFKMLVNETFWLSETPKEISKGWDAALNRIVVYGVFKNKINGNTWHVFNCHFDHKGAIARKKSAQLIMDIMTQKKISNEKVILMGDFNCLPTDAPIKIIKQHMEDSFDSSHHQAYGPIGTFNGFNTTSVLTKRIDYIFTKNIDVKHYRAIDDRRKNNLYPSDHLPVLIKL